MKNIDFNQGKKVLKVLRTLGIPGVAIGVFYLLLKGFDFKFSTIDGQGAFYIAVIFLVLTTIVTIFALKHYRSSQQKIDQSLNEVHNATSDTNAAVKIGGKSKKLNLKLADNFYLTSIDVNPKKPKIGDQIAFHLMLRNTGDVPIEIKTLSIIKPEYGWGTSVQDQIVLPLESLGINFGINAAEHFRTRLLSGNPHHFSLSIVAPTLPDILIDDLISIQFAP